jgi:hypothetical protein
MIARTGMLLLALPALLAAQAAVESGLGAARAATSAAPAQKASKAIAGALEGLTRTLQNADNPKSASQTVTTLPAGRSNTSAAIKPDVSFEDPSGIEQGMESSEVVRRFGPPALRLTTAPGEETLCYSKKSLSVDVTVRNGKVTAIQKSGASDQAAAKIP